MTILSVSLSDAMADWVAAQTGDGPFENASEYVRDLIRRDQTRAHSRLALQRFIDEGDASGVSPRTIDDVISDARAIARMRGFAE